MNENTSNIWRRHWKGPAKLVAWFGLLVAGCFVVIVAVGLLTIDNLELGSFLLAALIVSVLLGVLLIGGSVFIRWIACWRNFRRVLFVVACLVTVIALAYAEEDWRGKHAWRKHQRQGEAKGEKFNFHALLPPPVPDEKNFALMSLLKPVFDFTPGPHGTVWNDTNGMERLRNLAGSAELSTGRTTNDHLVRGSLEKGTFADLAACAAFYRGNTNYPQAPEGAAPAEVILTALNKFAPELKEFQEAAATRPDCRFPIHYDTEPSWGILLPHLAPVKGLTILTEIRAVAELEAGRSGDAFDDLKLGLRFSDSIRKEPILIDHLVRLATLGIDLQIVREGLVRHAWTEGQLSELEKDLGSINLLAEYQHAMEGERAFCTAGLDYLRRRGWKDNPLDYVGNGSDQQVLPLNVMPGGWYYQNMLTISRIFQEFTMPTVDAQARRVKPAIAEDGMRAIEAMHTGPYTVLAKILLPAVQKAVQKTAHMQTCLDAARVACALERYRLANGKLPDNLAALTPQFLEKIPSDLIDGQALRYRPEPDGSYVLYSIGWNRTDDGGKLAWKKDKSESGVDVRRGDWVWQMKAG